MSRVGRGVKEAKKGAFDPVVRVTFEPEPPRIMHVAAKIAYLHVTATHGEVLLDESMGTTLRGVLCVRRESLDQWVMIIPAIWNGVT